MLRTSLENGIYNLFRMSLQRNRISVGIVSFRYAFGTSPFLKSLVSYLTECIGAEVTVYVEGLESVYNNGYFNAHFVNRRPRFTERLVRRGFRQIGLCRLSEEFGEILGLSYFQRRLACHDIFFAAEFESLQLLSKIVPSLSNVAYLALEGSDVMRKYGPSHASSAIRSCVMYIAPSKERADALSNYLGFRLECEYVPVSLRPISVDFTKTSEAVRIIYSGILMPEMCALDLVTAFKQSRCYDGRARLMVHAPNPHPRWYCREIREELAGTYQAQLKVGFLSDEEHIAVIADNDIGVCVYRNLSGTDNFDNLLLSSGKLATYLWCGLAVVTNIFHEATQVPPFLYVEQLTGDSLRSALNSYGSERESFRAAALTYANDHYNFDTYMAPVWVKLVSMLSR